MKLSVYEKHRKNPFVEKALDEINNNIVRKYRNSSGYGKKAVLQAVDSNTGEILGHTTFIRQIEVDEDKFAKIYLSNFSAFHELGKQAIKVFGYILERLEPNKDMFMFFLDECMEHTKYATKKPIYRGLAELVESEIIARGPADTIYFINPMIVFNGNRITFAKTYVKKPKVKAIDPNQTNLLDQIEEIEDSKERSS
jgi:hypothetical protein